MSELQSTAGLLPGVAVGPPDRPLDAEAIARRALGLAMNSIWGGAEMEPLTDVTPELGRAARRLLCERVPSGREREVAIELLRRFVAPESTAG